MKKLKKYWIAAFFVFAGLLQSCDDDEGYSIGDIANDWVTIRVEGEGVYSFTGDTWGTMYPAANAVWNYSLVEGQRAFLVFNPLFDNYYGYDVGIKPERIYPFLTKSVEELTDENEEEFADHPAYLDNMWIAGGYLNVIFNQKLPTTHKHRVSLVKKAGEPDIADDGYIHLEYRYNTYGDTLDVFNPSVGVVCYNLNTLPLEEAKGIKLKINEAYYGERILSFENMNEPTPDDAKELHSIARLEVE